MDNQDIVYLTNKYPVLETVSNDVQQACEALLTSYKNNGKLLVCGNGGSCSDADHIVGELMKSFELMRPLETEFEEMLLKTSPNLGKYMAENLQNAVPAISLNAHAALISAVANDIHADLIFAQQIVGYGKLGDVFLGITTSGNSQNVINAAIAAKAKGLKVIGLTGEHGGKLKQYCDIAICVPAKNTADVQEFHLPVYHAICKYIERNYFDYS